MYIVNEFRGPQRSDIFFYSQNQICEKLAIPAVDFSHIPDVYSGCGGNGLPDRSLVRSILAAIATQSAAAERSTEPILSNICPADIRSEQWELINDINEEFNKVWIPICIHTYIYIHIDRYNHDINTCQDFSLRRKTLLQRLDVTVQSFILSKNLTDETREELRRKVEERRQQFDMNAPEYQV